MSCCIEEHPVEVMTRTTSFTTDADIEWQVTYRAEVEHDWERGRHVAEIIAIEAVEDAGRDVMDESESMADAEYERMIRVCQEHALKQ